MTMDIPHEIRGLCQALVDGLSAVLGDKLYGVYLYGAWAFPESGATGDVDLHVILNNAPDDSEKSALNRLHRALAGDYPQIGEELDAYYLLLEEARRTTPPRHQLLDDVADKSWALHRAHIRAGRCIVLQGPDPRKIYPEASWPELERALQGELDYVAEHLDLYPAYCVLNLCRLIYSFKTRDVVVSKIESARWADRAFPDWQPHIEAAKRSYAGRATAEDRELLKSEVGGFFNFARRRIEEIRGRS